MTDILIILVLILVIGMIVRLETMLAIVRNTFRVSDLHFHSISQHLHLIIQKQNSIMSNTDQALADIAAVKAQLAKIGTETSTLLQKIIDLQNSAPADTPQVVLDGLADLKVQAQVVDDLVPDATT